jgi:hypothetical protein
MKSLIKGYGREKWLGYTALDRVGSRFESRPGNQLSSAKAFRGYRQFFQIQTRSRQLPSESFQFMSSHRVFLYTLDDENAIKQHEKEQYRR